MDLLSINQKDNQEKARRVRLMGEIFASASQVVAWLGKASEDSDLVIDLVHALYKAFRDLTVAHVGVTEALLCGAPRCEYPSPTEPLAPARLELGIVNRAPDGLYNVESIFRMRTRKQKRSLQVTLTHCMMFISTDPRDKIYAVMGMVKDADDPMLDPDYGASTREVFISWGRYMLTRNTSLQVLHLAGLALPRLAADLPSWVSDWSAYNNETILGNIADAGGYRASGSTKKSSLGRHKTWIFGYQSGAVIHWIDKLNILVKSSPYYGHSDQHALWSTLIGNLIGRGYSAGEEYSDLFENWLSIHQDLAQHGNASKCTSTKADQAQVFAAVVNMFDRRAALWTHKGLLGLGPPAAQKGDLVCILLGAHTPFLLREDGVQEGQARIYKLVGECYVHGLMSGEGLAMGKEQDIILT